MPFIKIWVCLTVTLCTCGGIFVILRNKTNSYYIWASQTANLLHQYTTIIFWHLKENNYHYVVTWISVIANKHYPNTAKIVTCITICKNLFVIHIHVYQLQNLIKQTYMYTLVFSLRMTTFVASVVKTNTNEKPLPCHLCIYLTKSEHTLFHMTYFIYKHTVSIENKCHAWSMWFDRKSNKRLH